MTGAQEGESSSPPSAMLEETTATDITPPVVKSISEGSFVANFWRAHTDQEWSVKDFSGDDDKTEDDVSGISLAQGTRLVVPPPNPRHRKNGAPRLGFHSDFKTDDLDGMVVFFQAKANESISLALSPFPSYYPPKANQEPEEYKETPETNTTTAPGSTRYEIVLGANKNTSTTIQRYILQDGNAGGRVRFRTDAVVTVPSRVCRGFGNPTPEDDDQCWTSYWVCLSNSKVYVGMGKIPGKECFAVMEQPQISSAERQDESSNEPETSTTEIPKGTTPLPIRYVGFGNKSTKDSMEVRNLVVTNIPPCLDTLLKHIPSQDDLPIVCLPPAILSSSGMEVEDAETMELKKYMEQYKAECLVRKKRAQKYDTQYKEQPMKDFLPWTLTKRLLYQTSQSASSTNNASTGGFVAGEIDFLDPKEVSKREARQARFAGESKKDNDEAVANIPALKADGLPVEQAWDKEDMLRQVRRDPPPYLWKECPSNSETIETFKNAPDPFAMYDETTKAANWIDDKLHVSAIDWAAFKQIGNDDLLKHFESYGPVKYIEWLGDVNCNICFGSKHSATRALVCLSNELPSPPPLLPTVKKDTDEMKDATETDATTPPVTNPNTIDLGCMTWRFGKRPIRKICNDRRGRKGTTARYLLRMAMTEDVLVERPNSWPEPPGGFSSDRVLGPKSDFGNTNKKKRGNNTQRKQHQQQQQNRAGKKSNRKRQRGDSKQTAKKGAQRTNTNKGNSSKWSGEDFLNRGLSSSRAGFSVEEMEKERQAKKQKKN